MSARSPSVERIIAAALAHFARRGYSASSLTEIAEAVGIRKASLYAHFSCKDALFMDALADALEMEKAVARQCFAEEDADQLPGSAYCESLIRRYGESDHLRFFLRTGYVPPEKLEARINEAHETYLSELRESFTRNLRGWAASRRELADAEIALYVEVYLGIVDSVQVKLAYADERQAQLRLEAMQRTLAGALVHAGEH